MRLALRKDAQTRPVSTTRSIPAPVGGWNARDGLANMEITDAEFMVNWYPEATAVRTRRGSDYYASSLPNQVETIFSYAGGTRLKILCAASQTIIDITTVGNTGTVAAGRTVASGFANSRWQYINVGTPGGSYLIAVNGSDARQIYDGTNWYAGSASAGATAFTIPPSNVCLYNRRVFYTEAGTLRFIYHDNVNAIGGSVHAFDLSSQMDRGGYLVGIDTWTRDGGAGMDDLICFISNRGQVAVYSGIDPGSPTGSDWVRLGIYNMPAPMSYRSTAKVGSELVVFTEAGLAPMSSVVNGTLQQKSYITQKISKAINDAVRQYRDNWGWEVHYHTPDNMLFLNIPISTNSSQQQFVMNVDTGSWCRYKGWPANTFENHNNALYYGGNSLVIQAETGSNDLGNDVSNDVKQAASTFGLPGRLKHFKMFRPQIASDGDLPLQMGIDVDFSNLVPQNVPSPTPIPLAEWDVATWDDYYWADDVFAQPRWLSAAGIGTWGQVRMTGAVNVETIEWTATDIVFEPGEIV